MKPENDKGLVRRGIEAAIRRAMLQAYKTVRVKPEDYLLELRSSHGLAVQSYEGMFTIPVQHLDGVALEVIRSGMKMAALEGAGFGIGGLVTVVPDLGILAAITMRTVQKLSLIYGFEFNTEGEIAELWIAAASAAGVDISRELLERTLIRRFVRKVSARIATKVSTELAEKFAAKAVPVLSSAVGAVMNYYFVRAWSKRALIHFRERHLLERERRFVSQKEPMLIGPST